MIDGLNSLFDGYPYLSGYIDIHFFYLNKKITMICFRFIFLTIENRISIDTVSSLKMLYWQDLKSCPGFPLS